MNRNFIFATFLSVTALVRAASPYVAEVYEFCPAPGQFVNTVPAYDTGMSRDDFMKEVRSQLVGDGTEPRPGMLSLGAFGGYVVFGFDHPVVNVAGEYDFKIYGNAIVNSSASDGGSCEAGIVMVSADTNGNGIPDDQWFELAGSDYSNPSAFRNFKITYYRPDDTGVAANEPKYVRWTSNDPVAAEGYIAKNMFHRQSYWPGWTDADELTFEGTRLPSNAYQKGGTWVLKFFDWGYADNLPDDRDKGFKIEWAVDKDGNKVHLPAVDFIKVYTALNQSLGVIGETSTEITGAEDLHPDAVAGVDGVTTDSQLTVVCRDGMLAVTSAVAGGRAVVTDIAGRVVAMPDIAEGVTCVDMTALPHGVYIIRTQTGSARFAR